MPTASTGSIGEECRGLAMDTEQQQPLVSAIITTLKRPHVVDRAIRSVLDQTYANLELIVVVDGPDQPTVDMLERRSEPWLRCLALPENVGLAEARNAGVRASRGEWVAFLDDDDEWLPGKVATQLELTSRSGEEVNFVASRFEQRTNDEVRVWPTDFPRPREHWSDYFYCRAGLLLPSTFFVKRTTMLAFPFTRGLRRNEDADWLLRARAAGILHPRWTDEVLAVYHCEVVKDRLSTHAEWRGRYQWFIENSSLLTKKSIPYHIAMLCIPEAKLSTSPLRACCFLLKEAAIRGQLSPRAVAYLLVTTFSSARWRSNLRRRLPFLGVARVR
jgi:glycosyltransferase involved in cell wall biosynthesis